MGCKGGVDGWCGHCWPCGWFCPAEGGLRGRDVKLLNNVVNVFVFYHSQRQLCSATYTHTDDDDDDNYDTVIITNQWYNNLDETY